jgi:carbon dioxide concentrating mechanism protein CcmN
MYLPVLQAISTSEIYISGDVKIDERAVVAPGVILQAAPQSRIIIAAGACIGMGAILKAYQGTIEVKENAVLGAGVLIIGRSQIGAKVCIGTSTTIYNTSIESMTVIPAGSVIGDPTRSLKTEAKTHPQPEKLAPEVSSTTEPKPQELGTQNQDYQEQVSFTPPLPEQEAVLDTDFHPSEPPRETKSARAWEVNTSETDKAQVEQQWETPAERERTPIVGQVYVNNLLLTLFPSKNPRQ